MYSSDPCNIKFRSVSVNVLTVHSDRREGNKPKKGRRPGAVITLNFKKQHIGPFVTFHGLLASQVNVISEYIGIVFSRRFMK